LFVISPKAGGADGHADAVECKMGQLLGEDVGKAVGRWDVDERGQRLIDIPSADIRSHNYTKQLKQAAFERLR
jgi:hypothetical protein